MNRTENDAPFPPVRYKREADVCWLTIRGVSIVPTEFLFRCGPPASTTMLDRCVGVAVLNNINANTVRIHNDKVTIAPRLIP